MKSLVLFVLGTAGLLTGCAERVVYVTSNQEGCVGRPSVIGDNRNNVYYGNGNNPGNGRPVAYGPEFYDGRSGFQNNRPVAKMGHVVYDDPRYPGGCWQP